MATYKEIKGVTIQTRDEDPTVNAGSWSSGGNLNNTRYALAGVGANNSAALVFGGYPNGPTGQTEQYNGTSWTEKNDLNSARGYLDGAGTYTAALAFAGYATPPTVTHTSTETWDGTNWTEVTSSDMTTSSSNFSTGIKTVYFAEKTCTSGTSIKYKVEWANQGGSKETQLHGIALNY